MKILLVNTRHYYSGGDSTYTFHLAELLRAHGHQVSFFAMHSPQNLPHENSDLFVSHIDYRLLNQRKNPLTALSVLTRSIYSAEARRKFAQLIARIRPDIIHLQNIHAHITPSVILEAKKHNLPVVWTLHDYKLICPNSHFLNDATGQVCEACRGGHFWQAARQRCKKGSLLASAMASLEAYGHQLLGVRAQVDIFLCPSAFLRAKLLENGFDPAQTHHLPLFLPSEAFQLTGEDQGYGLFLGKMETLKGVGILLEAARQSPGVQLILAGRAEEAFLRQLPGLLPPNVTYHGFQTGAELAALRRGARFIVLPSLWYENQPFSLLEAFAAGKPVIASNIGGLRELVGANERGLLVPPGDPGALAQALGWMSAHPAEARTLGQAARQYAIENHSPEHHFQALLEIYQSIRRN